MGDRIIVTLYIRGWNEDAIRVSRRFMMLAGYTNDELDEVTMKMKSRIESEGREKASKYFVLTTIGRGLKTV